MKKFFITVLFVAGLIILANWGPPTERSEVAGDRLHRINFNGKVITLVSKDTEIDVDNISIGNNVKQIPVYSTPTTSSKHIDTTKHRITANPEDFFPQVRIDLSEIKTIETIYNGGEPIVWKYIEGNRKKGQSEDDKVKREYTEIVAVSNDDTKNNYLLENRLLLRFNEKSKAGPKETKLNFKGLIKLTIEEYVDRDLKPKSK